MEHLRTKIAPSVLLFFAAFSIPVTLSPSDLSDIDSLAPMEVVAQGFKGPTGVVVDSDGAVFVSDRKSGEVLKVNGAEVHPIVANLKRPVGLSFDQQGRLLVVEEKAGRLLRLEDNGSLTLLATGMRKPRWVAIAEDGTIYLTAKGLKSAKETEEEDDGEEAGEVILRMSLAGALTLWAEGFEGLQGITVDAAGSLFALAKGLKKEKQEKGGLFKIAIQSDGTAGQITRFSQTETKKPVGLAVDALGAFYVTAEEMELDKKTKDAIGKIASDGAVSRLASKLAEPRGLAFDSSGNLYVAEDRGDKKGRIIRLRAPPPPTLVFPSFTNQNHLIVHGTTEPNSRIDAFLNASGHPPTITTQDGAFALSLDLFPNAQNLLDVFSTAHNGQGLTGAPAEITIAHDHIAPVISNLQPLSGSFLNTTTPLIRADFSDNLSGVDIAKVVIELDTTNVTPQTQVTPSGFTLNPLSSLTESLHTVTVTIFDRANNPASASTSFTVDVTAPETQIISGPLGETNETTVTFTFTGTDNLTPAGSLLFSWRLDGGTWSAFSSGTTATFSGLSEGTHLFEVKARDLAGNEDPTAALREFSVVLGPVITALSPGSGTLGSEVTIQGRGFDAVPGKTVVKFNGVQTVITSITQTSIRTTVPISATTGRITVETPKGIGTSTEDFVVLLHQDFALSVSPEVGITAPGTSVTYGVRVLSIGLEPFTALAGLSVSGLPAGVTASFTPLLLSSSATALLTLATASATAAGSYPIEVRGTAQIEGRLITRTAQITLAVQTPGQTVLIGQVRDENEQPLPGVSIKQGGATITNLGMTDAGGNFFIPLFSISGPQVFLIDGSTANTSTVNYSTIPLTVDIQPNVVNTLGFIPRLHGQPIAKLTPIVPGQATVLTHPDVPGFTMTIPSGVEITGWDGNPNTQFSVTIVPIDRSPLPPPLPGGNAPVIYLFSFGKVGGGTPTGNIPIDTPNDIGGLPGDKVELYYFNEAPDGTAPNQWEWYGTGTVSSDGTRIITDINPATGRPYGFPKFCCGALLRRLLASPAPGGGPSGGQSGSGATAGEPVDTATGFFYVDKTDMVLPGILPIAITRTYRTQLTNAGPFGLGTSWPYDIFLQPPPNNSPDSLILFTPGNRQDLFSRQADGSFINTTSPPLRGAVVTAAGGIRSLLYKDGSLWRFDSAGRLISQADRNGNVITLTRDSQSRVTAITGPSGRQLTIFYSGTNLRIDRIQDPIGREVRYGYDGSARLISVTDPAGGITRYAYDTSNRMVSITDPRNITFLTNVYDGAGRVIQQTQADGGVWNFSYTTSGSFITQTTVTDPRGQSTTYRFNSSGFLISQTDVLGQTTTFERQGGNNLLLSTTDNLGRVTRFTYDANGNVTSITDPAGNVRTFEYEATFNKLTKITDPLGQITGFEYDGKGNLTATVDPIGARTTIAYNSFGQPTNTTDPLGNITTFTYDDFGNLVTIADPLGNKTQRAYDLVSRLIEQTDPRGRSTRFAYDGLNRITQITDALAGLTQFTYDGNGNLLTVTDARGSTITHTYDVMDRLATRTDPVAAVESFAYDGAGNLIRHTDRKGQVNTFSYDALNRRIGGSYADGASTSFVYDAAGRLIQATDSVAGTILNNYDNLDRLASQITSLGTVGYQYDALGRRTRMDVTGQLPVTYSYDAASRLRQIIQGPQVVDITYDAIGRRTRLALPNGVSTEYQYDAASRVTALIYRNALGMLGDFTYLYDAAGNRTGVGGSFARTLLPDPILSSTYDAANRQLTFANKTMTFDANGNLTSITEPSQVTTFTWDARDRLTGMNGPSMNASFVYDPFGRRVKKRLNSQSTEYLYDRFNPVQEISAVVSTNILTGFRMDDYFTRTDAVGPRSFLIDALGSIVALAGADGSVHTQYAYEPFGKTVVFGMNSANPFQYTGRENDDTGLFYYRARYYHPTLQRFISEDVVELYGGDINLYAYVRNSPPQLVDPSGLLASPYHFLTSFAAMTITGRNLIDSLVVAGASAYWDVGTQGPAYANTHAQVRPGQSIERAVAEHQQFIQQELQKGSLTGLGYANHAVEDLPRHNFEPFIEMNFLDPKYLWHLFRDWTPWPWELWQALKNDLKNIEQYDNIRRTNRNRLKRK